MMDKSYQNAEWTESSLSKLGTIGRGKSKHRPRNDASLFKGKYPFIQTSDVKHANFWVNSYEETYNEKGLAQSKLWPKNTLCITIAANIAESALLSFPACFPDSIVGFQENPDKSDVRFVKYVLDYYKKQYQQRSQGATQDNLSLEKIESLKVKVPTVALQKKIADIIYSYDILIENNEKRIKILEEKSQRLYLEWFVKFRFPENKKVKMLDSGTEYGVLPEGWTVKKFSEVVDVNPATKIISKQNILHVPMECLSNTVSVIDYTKAIRKDSTSGSKFKNGDILFARITPCLQNGKTGYVNFLQKNEIACGSTEFVVFRSKVLPPSYIYILARDENFREAAKLTMIGASGRQRVRPEFFENYKVVVPSDQLLLHFEKIVTNNFLLISELYGQINSLSKMRDLIIPQLVTGKRLLHEKHVDITAAKVNNHFKDAIIFSYYIKQASTPTFAPTHLRSVKTIYFANRMLGIDPTQKYSVQQFGPYDPKSKYAGGEKIALSKKYVQRIRGGYQPGTNISEINNYSYEELQAVDKALKDLRYKKDTELELLSTVDYVIYDLLLNKKDVTPQAVFDYIKQNSVWAPKIDRLQISIEKIQSTINSLRDLAKSGLSYPRN